jgi:predicted O-methyltransferase YrrM
MREFVSISFAQFSKCFWERVEMKAKEDAPHSTALSFGEGKFSVGIDTAYWLFCLTHYYKPEMVVEIGTYKGRSAHAMALGMTKGSIWTCDAEVNDPILWDHTDIRFERYNMLSTAMLAKLKAPVDLFFFDGRIQRDDVEHIKRLSHENTVYVLDDFEGLNKGVANAFMLYSHEDHVLVTGQGRLALLIPFKLVLTPQ